MADWDKALPNKVIWSELLRTLKPGSFCVVFSTPRLYHRLAVDIEDSGFLIKDQIMWITTTKMVSNRPKTVSRTYCCRTKTHGKNIRRKCYSMGNRQDEYF